MALALILPCSALAQTTDQTPPAKAHELTAVPVVGGDSDVGWGGGYLLSYARTPPGYKPYLWRFESGGAITFKPPETKDQRVQVPYVDDYLLFQFPHVRPSRFEVDLRLSYTREGTLKFYGLGNASKLAPGLEPRDRYFENARTHPSLRWLSTLHASDSIDVLWGLSYTHNWLTVPADTLLAQTMTSGGALEQRLLGTPANHGVALISAGLGFDTRDDKVRTQRGQYFAARADFAPGGIAEVPYAWGRLTASARAFVPLVTERLTLAARVVTDLLFGDPPYYELPRYDETYFGGGKGIRGVPAQRYWGKAKLFGNVELRSNLFSLRFWNKTNWFGLTAFADAGRVWTDYHPHPELDGTGVGLKYGVGGGLRVTAGSSFVLRADVAYSPDARPIAAYLTAGQMF